MFSKAFLLTCLRTPAPATPLFSHASLKHPGVVWASSNSCPLCNLRTLYLAPFAPCPLPLAHCAALLPVPQSNFRASSGLSALCSRRSRRAALRAKEHSFAQWCLIN